MAQGYKKVFAGDWVAIWIPRGPYQDTLTQAHLNRGEQDERPAYIQLRI